MWWPARWPATPLAARVATRRPGPAAAPGSWPERTASVSGVDVVDAVVATAVDEEGRGAGDAALVGAADVLVDARDVAARAHLIHEALDVQAEIARVLLEVAERKLALVGRGRMSYISQNMP